MKSEAQQSRDADLYLARQFGQAFVREKDSHQVRTDFNRVFKGDLEALEQFEHGVVEEDQKRLALGMSKEQFHRHHLDKKTAPSAKRSANARSRL